MQQTWRYYAFSLSKIYSIIKSTFWLSMGLVSSSCMDAPSNNQVFTIVTTTGIIADAVKHIVKEDGTVLSLMGPGIDPHTYQVTQKDIQHLKNADIIFYNGLCLEGKMTKILEKMAKEKAIYACGACLEKKQLIIDKTIEPIAIDPHIWFDIQLWQQIVCFISQKLQEARPQFAASYQKNTLAYLDELKQLHQETQALMQTIPKKQKILITIHDAFSYFGRAYDMEILSLQGISTLAECGLNDIQRIVKCIVENKIKAVFFEASISDKAMRAVLEGCTQFNYQIQIGGSLYTDALGNVNTLAGTYCGMIRANTKTIVQALK